MEEKVSLVQQTEFKHLGQCDKSGYTAESAVFADSIRQYNIC